MRRHILAAAICLYVASAVFAQDSDEDLRRGAGAVRLIEQLK